MNVDVIDSFRVENHEVAILFAKFTDGVEMVSAAEYPSSVSGGTQNTTVTLVCFIAARMVSRHSFDKLFKLDFLLWTCFHPTLLSDVLAAQLLVSIGWVTSLIVAKDAMVIR
jgi:hypothetical protein